MEIKKGKIFTITSMKGGVGKTTFVMSLAKICEEEKLKVLIMDLDFYTGNVAFSLNAKTKGSIYNLCDDMANNRIKYGVTDEYIHKINDYIDIVSSPKDPRDVTKIDDKYIDAILNNLVYKYDVILIDTNHVLNEHKMVAFDLSDKIIEILTNDAFDLQGNKTFMAICKNMKVDNVILVLNNSIDERKRYFSMYDIKNILGRNVNYIIPTSFYLKNYQQMVMDGDILNFKNKLSSAGKKDYSKFRENMKKILLEGGKDGK